LWKRYPKLKLLVPVFIIGFIMTLALNILRNPHSGSLEVDFLDAGSRNISIIRLPMKKTVLIDGGFSSLKTGGYIERSVLTPYLLKSGVLRIDYLILTSLDKDHLEGVKSILRKFRVESVWTNGRKLDGELWELIKNKGIGWKDISDGEVEPLEIEGVKVEFLKPVSGFVIKDSSLPYPVLVRLTLKDVSFLIGEGITDGDAIKNLYEIHRDKMQSEVVYFPKAPIGQKGSSEFISISSPKIIVTNSILENISKLNEGSKLNSDSNPTVFETDKVGLVKVITDGKEIKVKTFLDK
jgi:competence protein ComEC